MIKQLVMTRMMMVLKMKIWSFLFRGALCDRNPPFPSHDSPTDHCAQMLLIHCAQILLIHCAQILLIQCYIVHKCILIVHKYCEYFYIVQKYFQPCKNTTNTSTLCICTSDTAQLRTLNKNELCTTISTTNGNSLCTTSTSRTYCIVHKIGCCSSA